MSAGTFAYIKLHNMTEQVGGLGICNLLGATCRVRRLDAPLPRKRHDMKL